jgi:hypothetical protein
MNIGSLSGDALKQQQPTYDLAPNFTTAPPPDGPLALGTIVEDIQQYCPINQGAENRVPIPEKQCHSDVKEKVCASLKTSRSGEASILAKVFDQSIGGEAGVKGDKSDTADYSIEKLETTYFFPQPSYIRKCLQLPDVHDYLDMGDFSQPVYLITGIKTAWAATISTERTRGSEANAEAGVTVPGGAVDVNLGAKGKLAGTSVASSSFGKPSSFILGIQVQKIYHRKKFFSRDRVLEISKVTKGAVLVDDDAPDPEDTNEDDQFVLVDLEAEDLQDVGSLVEDI